MTTLKIRIFSVLLLVSTAFVPSHVLADANETAVNSPNAAAQASISSGGYHSCVVLSGGAANCWGYNPNGQVGDGSTTNRLAPVQVSGLTIGVSAISAGREYSCALLASGGAKCWGRNNYGQIGDGSTTDRLTPVQVTGFSSGVTAISGGLGHSCALLASGDVNCWGLNNFGQLGDGSTTNRLTPVQVSGVSSVIAISSGAYHSCALLASGGVKCWGRNTDGQLGDSTTAHRQLPSQVTGLASGVTAISAGSDHSCALLASGGVNCWGYNFFGQLGDGSTTGSLTPVQVTGFSGGVTAISAGADHSCALLASGGMNCWGRNFFGQLGDGSTTDRLTPVQVAGVSSVKAVSSADYHNCALLASGGVKCWGYNHDGQLGDGSTTASGTPVQVVGLSSGVGITTTTTTTIPVQTNNSVASSATTTTTTTVAVKVQPKFKAKGSLKFSKIASYAGVTVKAGSKVLVLVKPSSAKICAVKAGQLVAIKKGTCSFTLSVATTTKGKTTTKRTAVRLIVS